MDAQICELEGQILTEITGMVANGGDAQIVFTSTDGSQWRMYHEQDCCESVWLDDVTGHFTDLLHTPILQASEDSSTEKPEGIEREWEPDSETWTFYTFRTIKGTVTLRWCGQSNGYYSESVDFEKIKTPSSTQP
jgi:hypothetical protein